MARKYARDNRGRFASKGAGATARGGRLRTAAGNKRATQTMQAAGGPAGTIGKPRGLKPDRNAMVKAQTNQRLRARPAARALGATKPAAKRSGSATSGLRPGELMNAYARPVNTMARFQKAPRIFGKKKGENIEIAQAGVSAAGFRSRVTNRKRDAYSGSPASANTAFGLVSFNKADSFWANPRQGAIQARRNRQLSTSDPRGIMFHEIGHLRDKSSGFVSTRDGGLARRDFASSRTKALAGRVSRYATTSPREFTAEVFAGLRTGRKYDYQVMQAYRQELGKSPKPAARRRRRKPR